MEVKMVLTENEQELVDSSLKPFIRKMDSPYFIVFDFETNGINVPKDEALSLSAFKCKVNGRVVEVIDSYQRFYHPTVPYNPEATNVNHLFNDDVIKEKRGPVGFYSKHFIDDRKSFVDFCSGVNNFMGHNCIAFDCKYLDDIMTFSNIFDTMVANTGVTEYYWMEKYKKWHSPNLGQTASFYSVPFNKDEAHASEYDAIVTYKIFESMIQLTNIRMRAFDEGLYTKKRKMDDIF